MLLKQILVVLRDLPHQRPAVFAMVVAPLLGRGFGPAICLP
jgi:hypothetical protein